MRDFGEVEALLNARDEQRPERRQHHLPPEYYRATDVAFFVTLCARRHAEPFRIRPLAEGVIEALEHRRRQGVWWFYAYCLMPDHLHAVVQLRARAPDRDAPRDLLQVMGDFRSFTTRARGTVACEGGCGNTTSTTGCCGTTGSFAPGASTRWTTPYARDGWGIGASGLTAESQTPGDVGARTSIPGRYPGGDPWPVPNTT